MRRRIRKREEEEKELEQEGEKRRTIDGIKREVMVTVLGCNDLA